MALITATTTESATGPEGSAFSVYEDLSNNRIVYSFWMPKDAYLALTDQEEQLVKQLHASPNISDKALLLDLMFRKLEGFTDPIV